MTMPLRICDLPCRAIAAALACAASAVSIQARPAVDLIPADAWIALWIDDLSDATDAAAGNPYVDLLTQEEARVGQGAEAVGDVLRRLPISDADPLFPVWARLLPDLDSRAREGIQSATSIFQFSATDLTETFTDSLAIFSTMYDMRSENGGDIVEWDVVLSAEFQPDQRPRVEQFLAKALSTVPRDAMRTSVDYNGIAVNRMQYYLEESAAVPGNESAGHLGLVVQIPIVVEYTFADGVFLMAEGRGEPLRRSLRVLSDPRQGLAATAHYMRTTTIAQPPPGAYHLYCHLPRYIGELREVRSGRERLNVLTAVGMDSAEALRVDGRIDNRASSVDVVVTTPGSPRGLLSVLAGSPANGVQRAEVAPADSLVFGSLSLDINLLVQRFQSALAAVGGTSSTFVNIALANMKSIVGVDLQGEVLPAMNGEMVNYVRQGESGAADPFQGAVVIPMGGDEQVAAAVRTLLRKLNSPELKLLDIEESTFEGQTLFESPATTRGQRQSLHIGVLAQGLILATNGAELRATVRSLTGSSPMESLATNSEFTDFAGALDRDGLRGFVWQSRRAVALTLADRLGGSRRGWTAQRVLPHVGASHWTLHAEDQAIRLRMVMEPPPQSP